MNNKLSDELKAQIKFSPKSYYKAEPNEKYKGTFYSYGRYDCRNWVFYPLECEDGSVRMIDTYWSSRSESILLTDENFYEFKFLFSEGEVNILGYDERSLYDPKDIFLDCPIDSGGFSSRKKDFVKKTAKKIPEKVLNQLNINVESTFNTFKWRLEELNKQERAMGLPETTLESFLITKLL